MKDKKRRLELYSFYDFNGIALHLQKMANKGWMIEKINGSLWTYRRIEPAKLHFTVSYYPEASEFDAEPSQNQKIFYDFCAHTGWILAVSYAQMQIFYNQQENPTPVETDPVLEIETLHRAAKKSFLPVVFVLLFLALSGLALFIMRLSENPLSLLSSSSDIFTGFVWLVYLLICMMELSGYYIWRHKAKKAALTGFFLKTNRYAGLQRFFAGIIFLSVVYWFFRVFFTAPVSIRVYAALMFLYMAVLFFVVGAVKRFLKKKKTSAGINRTVTLISCMILAFVMMGSITFAIIKASQTGILERNEKTYEYNGITFTIHQDELPLTVEDLLPVAFDGYNYERRESESLFLGRSDMWQHARFDAENYDEMPEIQYTITQVKAPFLYDFCKMSLLNEKQDETADGSVIFPDSWQPADAAPWAAAEAYRHHFGADMTNNYLLCYKDYIVEIRFSWEPSPEQMAVAAEKLKEE